MAILNNKNLRKVTLSIILAWATLFFWLLSPVMAANIIATLIAVLCFLAIILEKNSYFIVIFLSFISSYVLYGFILVNNFPVWIIMIGLLLIYLYLYAYLEQMVSMIEGEKTIFLMAFSLISVETFLFLGYFVINPINRSLILAGTVYLVYGFLESVISKKQFRLMAPYILVFCVVFATMLLTATWGSN